jgi:hypothetical protein
MNPRLAATAALGLTLLLGACGGGSSGGAASSDTPTSQPAAVSTSAGAAPSAPTPTVRTDDLDAQLQRADQELRGAQQSVDQANDSSPERADD